MFSFLCCQARGSGVDVCGNEPAQKIESRRDSRRGNLGQAERRLSFEAIGSPAAVKREVSAQYIPSEPPLEEQHATPQAPDCEAAVTPPAPEAFHEAVALGKVQEEVAVLDVTALEQPPKAQRTVVVSRKGLVVPLDLASRYVRGVLSRTGLPSRSQGPCRSQRGKVTQIVLRRSSHRASPYQGPPVVVSMDLPELKVHAAQMANIPMQLGSGVLDRLRRLDVQGRALQALQLLKDNDYGADVPEDYVERLEHVNVTIEDMLKYLDEARKSSNDEGTDWTVVGGDEGMHLRFRYDWNTGRVEIVGDVLLQIDPIHAWAFMREFDLVPLWTRAEKSTLEATFGPESELYCVESPAASWMLSPTEAYSERTYIDALDEHRKLFQRSLQGCLAARSSRSG